MQPSASVFVGDGKQRVLSIQSHVVHGYVGNKAATFPLQLLGFEVDALNTVQFSNHTGYPVFKGHIFDDVHLKQVLEGLRLNGLLDRYSHLLTGYVGSESCLRAIHDFIQSAKARDPKLIYVLDPVLGDCGKLYVPKEAISIYQKQLCPLADIITPNHFEAELLTGISIRTLSDAQRAIEALHNLGIARVVITSLENLEDLPPHQLILLGSDRLHQTTSPLFTMSFKRMDMKFTGTGDLFAALILAYTATDHAGSFQKACERALNAMQAVLSTTWTHAQSNSVEKETDGEAKKTETTQRGARQVEACELRLIQSRDILMNPPALYAATPFSQSNGSR